MIFSTLFSTFFCRKLVLTLINKKNQRWYVPYVLCPSVGRFQCSKSIEKEEERLRRLKRMSRGGGRPMHNLWEAAGYELRHEKERAVAFCKGCKQYLKNTARKRLEAHRKKCSLDPVASNSDDDDGNEDLIDEIHIQTKNKKRMRSNSDNNDGEVYEILFEGNVNCIDNPTTNTQSLIENENNSSMKKKVQSSGIPANNSNKQRSLQRLNKIAPFFDHVSDKVQQDIDEAIANLFFGCNIPFDVINSDYFKNLLAVMRPAYKVPDNKTLSSLFLNKAHDKFKLTLPNFNNSECILLLSSQNIFDNTVKIMSFVQFTAESKVFIKSKILSDDEPESRDNFVQDVIGLVREKYNAKIYAIVSDNIEKNDFWNVKCNYKILQSLAAFLVDHNLQEKVNRVLHDFNTPLLEGELIRLGGVPIYVAKDSKWQSYYDSLNSYSKNAKAMRKILGGDKHQLNEQIVQLVFLDNSFESEVQDSVFLFNRIAELLKNCLENKWNIADAVESWLRLLTQTENITQKRIIDKHLQPLLQPVPLTANFLHPTYAGRQFMDNNKYINIVYSFVIDELSAVGLNSFENFRSKSDIFSKLIEKKCDSHTFWNLAQPRHAELAQFANKLLSIPAYTTQEMNVPVLQKSLNANDCAKLEDLYYFLKQKDSNVSEEY